MAFIEFLKGGKKCCQPSNITLEFIVNRKQISWEYFKFSDIWWKAEENFNWKTQVSK